MHVRSADLSDRPAIRDVARRSLQASYSLEPRAITTAIQEWYDEERLADLIADDERAVLLGESDEQVVGVSESKLEGDGVGTVLWLHVDPAYRGHGVGTELFEATRDRLAGMGASRLQGRVLADNATGNSFYREQALERVDQTNVEIAGRTYVENVYAETVSSEYETVEADGRTLYIDRHHAEGGSADTFHVVYADEDAEDRYGYYCTNCETLANAMDAMGRIECGCGNVCKPTRWDAAYL